VRYITCYRNKDGLVVSDHELETNNRIREQQAIRDRIAAFARSQPKPDPILAQQRAMIASEENQKRAQLERSTALDYRNAQARQADEVLKRIEAEREERNARLKRSHEEYEAAQKRHEARSRGQVCPHCQIAGNVRTQQVTKKVGISGGKASAAILTGGLSLLAVGLSRKERMTKAHCSNCGATWTY
jgi:hypothetical protein